MQGTPNTDKMSESEEILSFKLKVAHDQQLRDGLSPVKTVDQVGKWGTINANLDNTRDLEAVGLKESYMDDDIGLFLSSYPLRSSSDQIKLSDMEVGLLKQYQLDADLLSHLMNQVEGLNLKMKQVRGFIREQIRLEQTLYSESVVRIQAWYRGCICRRQLSRDGILLKSRLEFEARKVAVCTIQRFWYLTLTRRASRSNILNNRFQVLNEMLLGQQEQISALSNKTNELGHALNEIAATIVTLKAFFC